MHTSRPLFESPPLRLQSALAEAPAPAPAAERPRDARPVRAAREAAAWLARATAQRPAAAQCRSRSADANSGCASGGGVDGAGGGDRGATASLVAMLERAVAPWLPRVEGRNGGGVGLAASVGGRRALAAALKCSTRRADRSATAGAARIDRAGHAQLAIRRVGVASSEKTIPVDDRLVESRRVRSTPRAVGGVSGGRRLRLSRRRRGDRRGCRGWRRRCVLGGRCRRRRTTKHRDGHERSHERRCSDAQADDETTIFLNGDSGSGCRRPARRPDRDPSGRRVALCVSNRRHRWRGTRDPERAGIEVAFDAFQISPQTARILISELAVFFEARVDRRPGVQAGCSNSAGSAAWAAA